MGHRQDMTREQRLKWDVDNYKKRLEANKGSNYEYWSDKHEELLKNGWKLFYLIDESARLSGYSTPSEDHAKELVASLRRERNYARIVCGYDKNRLRIKMYSIIFKNKIVNFRDSQKILRKYIKTLKSYEGTNVEFALSFFTLLHNLLYIEDLYLQEVILCNKELNKYVDITPSIDIDYILATFHRLYDPNHKVRFSIETLDSIEQVRILRKNLRDMPFHTKILYNNSKLKEAINNNQNA